MTGKGGPGCLPLVSWRLSKTNYMEDKVLIERTWIMCDHQLPYEVDWLIRKRMQVSVRHGIIEGGLRSAI